MDFLKDTRESPPESITTDKAIELLLAAIAYEQSALGNIIDAEADKINNAALLNEKGLVTLDEVRKVNDSAFKVLKAVLKLEMLLEFELENLAGFISKSSTSPAATTTSMSTSTTTSTSTITTTTTASTPTTASQTSCSPEADRGKVGWMSILQTTLRLITLAGRKN